MMGIKLTVLAQTFLRKNKGETVIFYKRGMIFMKCPKCKQEVTGKFCSFCGALLEPDHTNDNISQKAVSSGTADRTVDPDHDFNFTIDYDTSFYTDSSFGAGKASSDEDADSGKISGAGSDPDSGKSGRKKPSKSSGSSGRSSDSVNQETVKQTVKQKTKVKKKKKKKGRISGAVSGSLSTAGSITTGSVRTIWKTLLAVIQWITAGLMLLITWKLFQGLWAQRTALGSLTGFIQERNVNQAAYLAVSICLIAFGVLQVLWIISRKKMPDNGRVRRLDMGRGTFGFLVFLLLTLIAHYVNPIIPEHPYPLPGIKQALSVVNGLGKAFMTLNVTGIVLCIVRKVGTR